MWNMNKLKALKGIDRDALLDYLGLETKRTTSDYLIGTVGVFGVGMLVGAGIGLLFAPKSGNELRQNLRERITGGPDQMAGQFPPAMSQSDRPPRAI